MSRDNLGFTSSLGSVDQKKESKSINTSIRNGFSEKNIFSIELQDKKKYVAELEDDYDPYCHRKVEHPTSFLDTLIHLLKGSLGTGILAMPKAFSHAGYVVGIVGTAIIGFICTYCIHLLVKAEYELCKRRKVPSLTYPTIAVESLKDGPRFLRSFSKSSEHVVNTFLLIYQLGTCCVYTVFIATNLKSALDSFMTNEVDVRLYMLAILLPLIFINWIRNLKALAPLSSVANVVTLFSFAIILYYLFREAPTMEGKSPIGRVEDFPLYFGTVLFALEAIGVIIPLENEMKNPKKFGNPCGVLNIGMISIIILYIAMGFFGYIMYGDDVKGSITLSLPDEITAKVAQILLSIAIFFTHALQCYVAIDIFWNGYLAPKVPEGGKKIFWEYIVRTACVLITFVLAVVIPELELFISLVGALCLSALGIAFPAIIQICTVWSTATTTERAVLALKNSSLVLFGLLGLIVGTYTSLRDIMSKFS